MRRLAALAALVLAFTAPQARAAVTITFWSHELGDHFPHGFFTLRGVPDAGGAAVEGNWGFTPVSISPKMLFGPVRGKVDVAKPGYVRSSDAQFSVVLTDAQYADITALTTAWSDRGDPTYRLETRNCVHFVREAARLAGLSRIDFPHLMKKPRSFLKSLADANRARVTVIDQRGRDYLASLEPLPGSIAAHIRSAAIASDDQLATSVADTP